MGLLNRLLGSIAATNESANSTPSAKHDATRFLELGMEQERLGHLDEAFEHYQAALKLMPSMARAHFNQGNILLDRGDAASALSSFVLAVKFKPDSAAAHFNIGSAQMALGHSNAAVIAYQQAISLKPDFADAIAGLASAMEDLGLTSEAIETYQKALQIKPDYVEVLHNLASLQQRSGQLRDAASSYRRILAIRPESAETYCNLGGILKELGEAVESIESYRLAIVANPNLAEVHFNFGVALQYFGQFDEAVLSYGRALKIAPQYMEAHLNLGVVFHKLGQFHKAYRCYEQAIAISPDYADAHINLGAVQKECSNFDAALISYRKALTINPDSVLAFSNFLFVQLHVSNQSSRLMLEQAKRFGELTKRLAGTSDGLKWERRAHKTLHIGFVSGDLRDHPVGHFIEGVLTALATDASGRLDVFAYPTFNSNDEVAARIKAQCKGWYSAMGVSDRDMAQRIRDDQIDILIDLSGHTAHNRLPLFAWKPAPVQVTWLGYLATTGVAAIDYVLADAWTLPESEEINFTEKVWRLPESYLCFTPPDSDVDVGPLPALANGHVTFGSFNNLAKINDDVVELWARVLHAVSGSRLYLKSPQLKDLTVQQRTRERFAVHGIDAGRLIFEGLVPRADYLKPFQRVDIALDSFPYPGITTSVENLWMGVPVLTLAGQSFLSRQGVGLMMNAELPQWIATNADDYVARAVSHAGDLQSLAALRAGLRKKVQASPIFDAARFAQHFEAAMRGMWDTWCLEQADASKGTPKESSINCSKDSTKELIRLHIGGRESKPGWKILNALEFEGVDFVGDVRDLSSFPDSCCEKIYASHVMEHVGQKDFSKTLQGIYRLLIAGGEFFFSVPDLEALCRLFLNPKLGGAERFHVMRMMFGGQTDDFDFHYIGLTQEFMLEYFKVAGFSSVKRVETFGLFDDTSGYMPYGVAISLNLIATK